jgi:hypothetical protein
MITAMTGVVMILILAASIFHGARKMSTATDNLTAAVGSLETAVTAAVAVIDPTQGADAAAVADATQRIQAATAQLYSAISPPAPASSASAPTAQA